MRAEVRAVVNCRESNTIRGAAAATTAVVRLQREATTAEECGQE